MEYNTIFESQLAKRKKEYDETFKAIENAKDENELRGLTDKLTNLKSEIEELNRYMESSLKDVEGRKQSILLGTSSKGDSSLEERKAFQKFIAEQQNIAVAKKSYLDARAAAGNVTTSDNVGTVIPENLVDAILEKIEDLGVIYNLVSKTNFPVGQTIPREALKPVATWVGTSANPSGEGNGSDVQKGVTLDTAIVFANFKIRGEVAMSEEVSVMTLNSFERLFIKNVSIALLRGIEFSVVDGDGLIMPTGILNTSIVSGNNIDIAANKSIDFKTLTTAEGLIPSDKEAGTKWCMSKKTFMSFMGMLDSIGQPIARVNFGLNGKIERSLLGRDVVIYTPQSSSKLGNYADTVSADTIFAFLFDFSDYTLNNNYNLGIQSKVDWDNEDHRTKAVGAYDGKVIDNRSLITLTKKA